jgi:uncharacterized membrane protein
MQAKIGKDKSRWWFRILIVWLVILFGLYGALSVVRHQTYLSGAYDLGLYDQSVWQYAHFLYPFNTIKDKFILGDHLTLTLPLFAPLFWLWDDVRILLIAQAAIVTSSSIAIFLIAKKRQFSGFVSCAVAFVYSLFYGIQFAVFFDFHPVVLGVALVAWTAYFTEIRNRKWQIITIILLLLTQENMGISLAGLGFIYFFRKEFRRTGIWYIVIGIVYSLLASRIIAFLSPNGFEYTPKISMSPIVLLKNLADSPEKRQVWLYTLAWFSLLPALSFGAMLAVILDLSQYFLTGPAFSRMWSPFMHHRAILAPFLAIGTLDVLGRFRNKKVVIIIACILIVSALVQQYGFHFAINKLAKRSYWQVESWMKNIDALIKTIPPELSVAAQQNIVPHLSHREKIYLVYPRKHDFPDKPCGQVSCWWLDFAGRPDYLVVDTHPNQWLTQLLESNENFQSALTAMQNRGMIVLVRSVGDARLYKISYK